MKPPMPYAPGPLPLGFLSRYSAAEIAKGAVAFLPLVSRMKSV